MTVAHGQSTGYWLREALRGKRLRTRELEGQARADVCILGGGFTGLWTALRLKAVEPSLDVAFIEKDFCGSGTSGRSAGFCMTWSSKILTLAELYGAQEAQRLFRASEAAVGEIGGFCRDRGIDAQFRQDGWLWTASNAAQRNAWLPCLDQLERLGVNPFEVLDADEVAWRGGTRENLAGVYEPTVAALQPGRLALGLRRVAIEAGVRIFERSPVMRIDRGPRPRLRTRKGALVCDGLVLALNAWAAELPEFRRTLLLVMDDQLITEPAPEALAGSGLAGGLAVSDSRLLVHFYRATPDGRIVFGRPSGAGFFGGRVGERAEGESRHRVPMERSLRRFLGGRGHLPVAESWCGPVTRTRSGLPSFGRLDRHENIVYGHGYCGNGIGPSFLGARILASLVLGHDDEWSTSPLVRHSPACFPPEPLRYAGACLVRDAVARIEMAQDRGIKPRTLDAWLARFAPQGLVPTQTVP